LNLDIQIFAQVRVPRSSSGHPSSDQYVSISVQINFLLWISNIGDFIDFIDGKRFDSDQLPDKWFNIVENN